jgi:hypothetical protein
VTRALTHNGGGLVSILYDHRPGDTHAVDVAELALRTFRDDLTRAEAAQLLLDGWMHEPPLSAREREALLARFAGGRR